tara:strand:+ start:16337 stop:16867 length:531 start_codon:yes stop_codon:yes gene_type:complete
MGPKLLKFGIEFYKIIKKEKKKMQMEDEAKRSQLKRLIAMLDGRLEEPAEDLERDELREGGKMEAADVRDVEEHLEAPLEDEHPLQDEREETEAMEHRTEESLDDLDQDADRDSGDEVRDGEDALKELVLSFMNPEAPKPASRSRMMAMDPAATISKTSLSMGEAPKSSKRKKLRK